MARKRTMKVSVFDYPEHLNPFREEEEEERRAAQAALEGRTSRCHLLLGSPCGTLRSSSMADFSPSSSGMSTPVNGTLRRRMKRRAPLPPILSPPVPASLPPDSQHELLTSPDELPHMTITEAIVEEKTDRLQTTPTDNATPEDPVQLSTPTLDTPSEPPDPSEVQQSEETNERLNTDKIEDKENNSESPLPENHIENNNDSETCGLIDAEIKNTQKEEDKLGKDDETKDVTELTSEQKFEIDTTEQKIEREKSNSPCTTPDKLHEEKELKDENKVSEESNSAEGKQTEENEINTEAEDIKIMTAEEKSDRKIEDCAPLSEETLVSENLAYIDQDVSEKPSLLPNGDCKSNGDGRSPVGSPRLCTDRFTTQVSHVEIRISDIADV